MVEEKPFKSFEDIGSQQFFVDHLLSLSSRRCARVWIASSNGAVWAENWSSCTQAVQANSLFMVTFSSSKVYSPRSLTASENPWIVTNGPQDPKRKPDRLPSTIFQERAVKLRWCIWTDLFRTLHQRNTWMIDWNGCSVYFNVRWEDSVGRTTLVTTCNNKMMFCQIHFGISH